MFLLWLNLLPCFPNYLPTMSLLFTRNNDKNIAHWTLLCDFMKMLKNINWWIMGTKTHHSNNYFRDGLFVRITHTFQILSAATFTVKTVSEWRNRSIKLVSFPCISRHPRVDISEVLTRMNSCWRKTLLPFVLGGSLCWFVGSCVRTLLE